MIYKNQMEYYAAINASNTAGESTIFVTFMLKIIREMLKEIVDNQRLHEGVRINVGVNVGINVEELSIEERIWVLLRDNPQMTAKQLSSTLVLSVRQVERAIAALKAKGGNKDVRAGAGQRPVLLHKLSG